MQRRQRSGHKQAQSDNRRLRKQPKMRRVQATHPLAQPKVSSAVKQRRRRNSQRFRLPMAAVRRFLFSARWISLLLLALMVYALYLVGMDTSFYLTVIPVEGNWSVPATEVVNASGLAGAHVFAADPVRAAERITQVPGIISATVTLSWPNQVLVQVAEDAPVVVWRENGTDYWVAESGRLIPSRVNNLGLLRIESEMEFPAAPVTLDDSEIEVAAYNRIFVPEDVLDGALQLRELRPNIEQLYYRPATGLSYLDGRGWRAYFGTGTAMAQKLVVYESIVDELLSRELTPQYISVSNQEKPYYQAN